MYTVLGLVPPSEPRRRGPWARPHEHDPRHSSYVKPRARSTGHATRQGYTIARANIQHRHVLSRFEYIQTRTTPPQCTDRAEIDSVMSHVGRHRQVRVQSDSWGVRDFVPIVLQMCSVVRKRAVPTRQASIRCIRRNTWGLGAFTLPHNGYGALPHPMPRRPPAPHATRTPSCRSGVLCVRGILSNVKVDRPS